MLGGALIGLGVSILLRGIPGTGGALSLNSAGHAISHAPVGENALITAAMSAHDASASVMLAGSVFGPGGYLAGSAIAEADQNSKRLNAALDHCKKLFPDADHSLSFLNF